MRRFAVGCAFLSALLLGGCSVSEYGRIADIASSAQRGEALKSFAIERAGLYAQNPERLSKDIDDIKNIDENIGKIIRLFVAKITESWGRDEVKKPTNDTYVKYSDNYKSRSLADFKNGKVIVETIKEDAPKKHLQELIVTTLLTPQDPRYVDIYSADAVELKGRPFLADLIRDHDGKVVLYKWRANRFAAHLINTALQKRSIDTKNGKKRSYYVEIDMVKNHIEKSANKYSDIAKKMGAKYGIDSALILAIMKTESSFNPYATSHIPAYGLMQIVPATAGVDAYKKIYGKKGRPDKNMLFDAKTNIEFGAAYLNILKYNYLKKVRNERSKEYCVISAYNTGSGNVLRTFDRNRERAFDYINSLKPDALYWKLKNELPYAETRRYLDKVNSAKKEFIYY